MELIVISESKLKIMLTAPDMVHYELEAARMDCADAHTRAAFRHIFDDARAEIGFETQGERLFVQLYTSKEGGCEIFVTKLGDEEAAEPFSWDCDENMAPLPPHSPLVVISEDMSPGERELIRRVCGYCEEQEEAYMADEQNLCIRDKDEGERLIPRTGTRRIAMVFSNLEHVLAVCRRLLRGGYRGRNSIYITDTTQTYWYLLMEIPDVTLYRLPRRFAFLTEYGREVNATGLETYLKEYGKCIREGDGVDVLGKL